MKKFLKQLFCLHYPILYMGFCAHCGKEFTRRNGYELHGLDLLKIKFNQWRCKHTLVDGGYLSKWCNKCYKIENKYD